jgi:hypothetical protein
MHGGRKWGEPGVPALEGKLSTTARGLHTTHNIYFRGAAFIKRSCIHSFLSKIVV